MDLKSQRILVIENNENICNLISHRRQAPDQILDAIYKSVRQIHPDNQSLSDDITCLLLKFQITE